jgi:tetratricopeptide (TPR) repeat protein
LKRLQVCSGTLLVMILLAILLSPAKIFSKPTVSKKTPTVSTPQAESNLKQWQALKTSFHQKLSKGEDTSELFVLLPSIKSTQNAEEVIEFFQALTKQYNIKLTQIPCAANPSIRDKVLFSYLEEAPSRISWDEAIEMYEEFNRRAPSIQYIKAILAQICYKNMGGEATSEDEEKFSHYIDQFNQFEIKSSTDIAHVKLSEAFFWFVSKKYEYSIPIYEELISDSTIAYDYRSISLRGLIKSYLALEKFEEAEVTLFIYHDMKWAQDQQDALIEDLRGAYEKKATTYKKEKDYIRAIEWYRKVAELEKTARPDWPPSYVDLYESYFQLAKKNPGNEQYMDQILAIPDDSLKFVILLGVGDAYFELQQYTQSLNYLEKAREYFFQLQEPNSKRIKAFYKDDLFFNLGYSYSETNDFWKAIEAYKTLPQNAAAQHNLALIWIFNLTSKRNAIEVIQKVKKLDKEKYNVLMDRYEEVFGEK